MVSSGFHEKALKTEVDLLVEFVNTRDIEERTDALADPAALPAWIGKHTELELDPEAAVTAYVPALRGTGPTIRPASVRWTGARREIGQPRSWCAPDRSR